MFDIITIGDCIMDNFVVIDHDEATIQCGLKRENCQLCLNYADKIPIKQIHQAVGGNAANVALGCQKLGLKTAIISELGDDLNGIIIKQELSEKKIDTKLITLNKNQDTRFNVILNYQGERTVLSSQVKRNYHLPAIPSAKWLYYTSLGASFEKVQNKLLAYLKKYPGTKLAYNPGSYELKKGLKKVREILPKVDLLFINKEEGAHITKCTNDPKIIGKKMLKIGVKIIVITDGDKGAFVFQKNQTYFLPIYPAKVVSKAGAGDAFASGFVSALIKNKTIPEALQWGTANAANVIQKIGAQEGLSSEKQLLAIIKKYSKIQPKKIS